MPEQFFFWNFCDYESLWGFILKPESDALNIEIENWKIKIWQSKQ